MGLSVGVVNIDYLEEPPPPVSDFLKELAINPDLGIGKDDDNYWCGGWGGNTFLEFPQSALMARADSWCTDKGISASGQTSIVAWVSNLPWRNGHVLLHLGV